MGLRVLISRLIAVFLWGFSRLFYRFETRWINPPSAALWREIRVFAFMHHTSLMEPLFFGAFPLSFLWWAAAKARIPGADKTMKRPIVGKFYQFFSPNTIAISRKRDASWEQFLAGVNPDVLVALAPEGRMMRPNGLDSEGKAMSVRGGIADILLRMGKGKMLLAYSGGLHHVNQPGQKGVRLFQTLRMNFEWLEIADYLHSFATTEPSHLRVLVARDLEARLALHRPVSQA